MTQIPIDLWRITMRQSITESQVRLRICCKQFEEQLHLYILRTCRKLVFNSKIAKPKPDLITCNYKFIKNTIWHVNMSAPTFMYVRHIIIPWKVDWYINSETLIEQLTSLKMLVSAIFMNFLEKEDFTEYINKCTLKNLILLTQHYNIGDIYKYNGNDSIETLMIFDACHTHITNFNKLRYLYLSTYPSNIGIVANNPNLEIIVLTKSQINIDFGSLPMLKIIFVFYSLAEGLPIFVKDLIDKTGNFLFELGTNTRYNYKIFVIKNSFNADIIPATYLSRLAHILKTKRIVTY